MLHQTRRAGYSGGNRDNANRLSPRGRRLGQSREEGPLGHCIHPWSSNRGILDIPRPRQANLPPNQIGLLQTTVYEKNRVWHVLLFRNGNDRRHLLADKPPSVGPLCRQPPGVIIEGEILRPPTPGPNSGTKRDEPPCPWPRLAAFDHNRKTPRRRCPDHSQHAIDPGPAMPRPILPDPYGAYGPAPRSASRQHDAGDGKRSATRRRPCANRPPGRTEYEHCRTRLHQHDTPCSAPRCSSSGAAPASTN